MEKQDKNNVIDIEDYLEEKRQEYYIQRDNFYSNEDVDDIDFEDDENENVCIKHFDFSSVELLK